MNYFEFDERIKFCRIFAEMLGWEKDKIDICTSDGNIEFTYLYYNNITLTNNTIQTKNKILAINYRNKEGTWRDLMRYKKHPEKMKNYGKQRPAKDRLFNLSLTEKVPLTFQQLEEMERMMDECIYPMRIEINIYMW